MDLKSRQAVQKLKQSNCVNPSRGVFLSKLNDSVFLCDVILIQFAFLFSPLTVYNIIHQLSVVTIDIAVLIV